MTNVYKTVYREALIYLTHKAGANFVDDQLKCIATIAPVKVKTMNDLFRAFLDAAFCTKRMQEAIGSIENLGDLMRSFDLQAFAFERRTEAIQPQDMGRRADGGRTDILAALSSQTSGGGQGGDNQMGTDLAGIVLISDGADTEKLGNLARTDSLPRSLQNRLQALSAPVNTFSVGSEGSFVDLAVVEVASVAPSPA